MAMWAGVQNVSRPIERCHEMSQMTPTFALVAAISAAATYQGTTPGCGAAPARGPVAAGTGLAVARPSRHQPPAAPLLEDLLHLLVRVGQRVLRAHPPRGRVREHGGQHERVEYLALRRVGRAGVPDVRRPFERRGDGFELGGRSRAERIVRCDLLEPLES